MVASSQVGPRRIDPTLGPTFVIGGAQKAGTTSLFFLLDQHPDIYGSAVKEPAFFAYEAGVAERTGPGSEHLANPIVQEPREYEALFRRGASSQHRLEASTMYFSEPGVPEALRAFNPSLKVVFVLRDPAERAYSAFNFLRLRGLETLDSVLEGIAAEPERLAAGWPPSFGYLRLSSYGDHLERFFGVFPESQILCLNYKQLVVEPLSVLREMERFLGLPPFAGYALGARHNPGGSPRFSALHRLLDFRAPRVRGRLRQIAPRAVHRRIVAIRNWNQARPPDLTEAERRVLIERLRPQIEAARRITGDEMVEGWSEVKGGVWA